MAAGDEIVEIPTGEINGFNVAFVTSLPYEPGTLRVFKNGQLIRGADDDGQSEDNPSAGAFSLGLAPLSGDTVHARFVEA
jgi:hypothetical protein